MADLLRGRRRGRGRARGRGLDDDAPANNPYDPRDEEIALMGPRIAELERRLAAAMLGSEEVDDVGDSDSHGDTSTGEDDGTFNP